MLLQVVRRVFFCIMLYHLVCRRFRPCQCILHCPYRQWSHVTDRPVLIVGVPTLWCLKRITVEYIENNCHDEEPDGQSVNESSVFINMKRKIGLPETTLGPCSFIHTSCHLKCNILQALMNHGCSKCICNARPDFP